MSYAVQTVFFFVSIAQSFAFSQVHLQVGSVGSRQKGTKWYPLSPHNTNQFPTTSFSKVNNRTVECSTERSGSVGFWIWRDVGTIGIDAEGSLVI